MRDRPAEKPLEPALSQENPPKLDGYSIGPAGLQGAFGEEALGFNGFQLGIMAENSAEKSGSS